jgi:hypothetical protein
VSGAELTQQRHVVDRFLAALRGGDFDALVAVLDPDVVVRADAGAPDAPREIRGAATWARQAIAFVRGAQFVRPLLVNGEIGLILAPRGRLMRVLRFTMVGGTIVRIEVIADPSRLQQLDLAVLDD